MKKLTFVVLTLACATAAFSTTAQAQSSSATTSANASATVVTAISLTKTADMNFADVVTGATSGTVVLTASASPTRSVTGGTLLGNSAGISSATFTVAGDPSATYSITLPASAITLTAGANTMTVDTFTSSPSATGTLSAGGSQTLYTGATLNVGATQANGAYTGTFSVTVAYN